MSKTDEPQQRTPSRGIHGIDYVGSAILYSLRTFDVFVQYKLLRAAPLTKFLINKGYSVPPPPSGGLTQGVLGLSPYQTLVWGMHIGSTLKHIHWAGWNLREPMWPSAALLITAINTVVSTSHTLASSLSGANPTYSYPSSVYLGTALYVVGWIIEVYSETERKWWKDNPENDGQIMTSGMWSWSRHINFAGFCIWRAGQGVVAGGPLWGLLWGVTFFWDFYNAGVPLLELYMERRYGQKWEEAKRKVPWRIFPKIY